MKAHELFVSPFLVNASEGIQVAGILGLRSHLPHLHAVEHVVLDAIDFVVPALVEVAVKPEAEGMALGVEIGIEVVHDFTLALHIVQQVFIAYRPGV